MARDHARVQVAIWRDADFRALSAWAQYVYLLLVSQPALSYCGVMDWWPNRLAALSYGTPEQEVFDAVKELMDARFVHLDVTTSEVLVRSYVRHDGILARKNMGKAMGRALEKVTSMEVREVIMNELARAYRDDASLAGWEGFDELYPDEFADVISIASGM